MVINELAITLTIQEWREVIAGLSGHSGTLSGKIATALIEAFERTAWQAFFRLDDSTCQARSVEGRNE